MHAHRARQSIRLLPSSGGAIAAAAVAAAGASLTSGPASPVSAAPGHEAPLPLASRHPTGPAPPRVALTPVPAPAPGRPPARGESCAMPPADARPWASLLGGPVLPRRATAVASLRLLLLGAGLLGQAPGPGVAAALPGLSLPHLTPCEPPAPAAPDIHSPPLSPCARASPRPAALLRARHRNVSFVSSRGTSLAGSGSMSLFLLSSPECSSAGEESEPDDAEPTADTTSVSSFKIHTSLEADDRPVPGEPRDAPAQAMAPGRAPGFVMALSPRSESSSPVEALPPAPGPKPEPAAIPAGPSSDLPVFEIAPAEAAAEASGPATPALFVSKETHPRAGLPRPPSLSGSTSGNLVASRGRRQWGGIARMSLAHLLVSIVVAFLVGVALAAFNSRGLGALVGSPA
ncbi:hypothetical protein H696_05139 [Fonticula alba]|uniref:Uncharacterized protein n=1 Tax=Fonticula alba TaxID=691883 RepID=A0A058Z2P9_FONAL|nr:hypothetical protein H696_05139 [Fonticula alba]KCV68213.1 hypothetical protein H696_05139 [Fonticula alba]|eukprot:XP_009497267.1 hypothetical protein H696_05139 [Fonticula alba]